MVRTRWLLLLLFVLGGIAAKAPQHTITSKAQVSIFLSTECPISQQYTRRLSQLYREFDPQGVCFTAYFPLRTDDYRTIGRFTRDYLLPFPTKPDTQQRVARRFKATITPEVVVQDASGTVVYQGAIDDWFVSLGRHRPEPSRHYLRDALQATLDGRPVAPARTEAVGCFIE